ncbi:hypothetical protein PG996_008347 [Apiospora saccharicola]|uniref:CENP-V/GFA domain-containing protein n=1 Tax=Apiospora saccharicola TaxID=335842 RepID=A0ABR1V067_9PEZI
MSKLVAGITQSPPASLTKAFNHDKVTPSGPHETKKFAGRCHCSAVQFSVSLPVASLPLRSYFCHCSICRYSQGTYARMGVILPPGIEPDWMGGSMSEKVAEYKIPGSPSPRLFCSTCGSTIGGVGEDGTTTGGVPVKGQWCMMVSLFDNKFWHHCAHAFPKSVPGGGLLDWLLHPGAAAAGAQQEEILWYTPDESDFSVAAEPEHAADGTERLRAECHCGGVSFTIPRPTQDILDDEYLRKYVSPLDSTKWKAMLDLCRDCGRSSGANVVPWMLVPRTYKSSEPTVRGFCGVCGATVFGATKHREPTAGQAVLNVAMGLLRAPEGVRAENWVTWRAGKHSWLEDAKAYDEEFTVSLVEGHRRWALETYGEASEFDVV